MCAALTRRERFATTIRVTRAQDIVVDWGALYRGLNTAVMTRADDLELAARIRRARVFIQHNLERDIDLQAIAGAAHYSRYHLLRAFRRRYGETPHQYLTRCRIERARELLRTTELSVTEVCLAVGYQSLGSFSALFRRHVGHAPQRYRRRFVQSPAVRALVTPRAAIIPGCYFDRYRMLG